MDKRTRSASACSGLAILAGSLTFMGTAQAAVTILSENFEGAGNVFGAGTYNYAQGYTMPNLLVPGGGAKYMNGGTGTTGSVSTNNFTGGSYSLLAGGITGAQIDSGLITYNLYSQFSTYRFQPVGTGQSDYATLFVQFRDVGSNPIGAPLSLGGQAFTYALGSGNNGQYPDARDWGADSAAGIVPAGARFASVSIQEIKSAPGSAIDGYVDNVNVSLNPVPEPGAIGLFGLGGGLLALVGRRR